MRVNATLFRRCGAEFLGTFAYVFFGTGVRILEGKAPGEVGRFLVFLTFGLTLFTMTYALNHISAAPFNPAVTFGLAASRRFPWRYVLPYWLAQIGGACGASAALFLLVPQQARQTLYGATIPTVGPGQAVAIEALISFFLMLVAMPTATERRVNRAAVGLATGLTVTLAGFFASPLTGGSLNPARSLGPALFAGGKALSDAWIYWLGPLVGAAAGAFIYELLRGEEAYAMQALEDIFQHLKSTDGSETPPRDQ